MQRRGVCCRSVHGCMCRRGTWFALFVILSLLSGGFLFGSEKTLCVFIRGWLSDCDICQLALLPLQTVMKMFRPTRLSLSESVDFLSADYNTCPLLLLHSDFQHHFYHLFRPPHPHQVPSDPLTSSLFTLPLSCVLAKVQVSVEIYLISIFTFKGRFIEPVWQSWVVVGSRKHHAFD